MLFNPRPDREQGKTFLLMLLVITPTLLVIFGATFDLGQVATGVQIAQQAADLGAWEAARMVDVTGFGDDQEIILRPGAADEAQYIADDMTGGKMLVTDVYVIEGDVIVVEGRVCIKTGFLSAFVGKRQACRLVQGVARAMHGITQEDE